MEDLSSGRIAALVPEFAVKDRTLMIMITKNNTVILLMLSNASINFILIILFDDAHAL